MEIVKPTQTQKNDIRQINYLVSKIQAAWRGYQTRKRYLKMRKGELGAVGKSFNRVSTKGVMFKDEDDR